MKKIFSVVLISVFIFMCGCFFVSAQNIAGDVDSDGFVRAADARIVLRAAVGLEALHKDKLKVADVDNNGIINSADARIILRAAVGLEVLHIHTYNTEIIIKEATCVAGGQKRYVCACSEYNEEIISATGHKFDDLLVLPTCTQNGYIKHSCSVCSYTSSDTYVDKFGHKYRSVVTAPTCTQKGYTTKTCENCSDKIITDYVSAKGHSYKSTVTAPTCTAKGYTSYRCCDCAASYIGDYVNTKGHSYKITEILPTCILDGEKIYTCLCGDSYRENIPAVGHSFDGAVCSVCSAPDPDYVPSVKYGGVKGCITFEDAGAAVGDRGAKLLLIPMNSTVKTYDNILVVSFVPGDYESGIRVRECDSSGSYNFSSEVPVGTYLLIAVSANSNSVSRYADEYSWNSYITDLLDEYFSQPEISCFKAGCSYYRIEAREIAVTADTESVINITFEASDW